VLLFSPSRLSHLDPEKIAQTGANSITVTPTPNAFDPIAFTMVHKDPAGTPFRTSTIALVHEGGVTRLRAESTYAGVLDTMKKYDKKSG